MFKDLLTYRFFILSSIKNDLVSRFARSKFGSLWVILNPLSQVLIYALILSNVLAAKLPGIDNKFAFAIYLMAGTLGWSLFSEIISRSTNLFLDNANMLKKINFPRITLPAIMIGSAILNNLFLLLAVLIIFMLLDHSFGLTLLWIIPLMGVSIILGFGIGFILGIFNVFVRDIGQVIPIVLQIMFWFTPIVYPANIIPERYLHILKINPLYPIIEGYHDILLYGKAPEMMSVLYIGVIGLIISILGLFMFRKAGPEMVDVL